MKNQEHEKPSAPVKPQGVPSVKDQKLALALRRNLARRKNSVHGRETGSDT